MESRSVSRYFVVSILVLTMSYSTESSTFSFNSGLMKSHWLLTIYKKFPEISVSFVNDFSVRSTGTFPGKRNLWKGCSVFKFSKVLPVPGYSRPYFEFWRAKSQSIILAKFSFLLNRFQIASVYKSEKIPGLSMLPKTEVTNIIDLPW